jgi:hypothetical protein
MIKPYLKAELKRCPDPQINQIFVIIHIGANKERYQSYSFWFANDKFKMACPGEIDWEQETE